MRALALIPLLAACQTAQPGIEVRTVEVPTPVACVNAEEMPEETPRSDLTGNARQDVVILAAENLDLRAENGDLRALIVPGCTIIEQ